MHNNNNSKRESVRSIERALDVLNTFSLEKTEQSLGEISCALQLPKSTTHRILCTLENKKFIEQNPENGNYYLSFEIVKISNIIQESDILSKSAMPIMKWLVEQTDQTSNLYVIRGYQRICTAQVEGSKYKFRYSYVGAQFPLYCGASGQVLLAFSDVEYRDKYYENVSLEKLTENTITDKKILDLKLLEIRDKGYCVSIGQRDDLTASIAAPIYNYSKRVIATITVSGLVTYYTPNFIKKVLGPLLEASNQISKKLGYMLG